MAPKRKKRVAPAAEPDNEPSASVSIMKFTKITKCNIENFIFFQVAKKIEKVARKTVN